MMIFEFTCLPQYGGGKLKIDAPWVNITVEDFRAMLKTVEPYVEPVKTEEEKKAQALAKAQELEKSNRKWEAQKFEKATKISSSNYEGEMLYSENYGNHDGYFRELEELIEYCEDEDVPVPTFVWACKLVDKQITAERVFEFYTEDLDDWTEPATGSFEKLQAALDEFYKANSNCKTYEPDYKIAVLVEATA